MCPMCDSCQTAVGEIAPLVEPLCSHEADKTTGSCSRVLVYVHDTHIKWSASSMGDAENRYLAELLVNCYHVGLSLEL